MKIYILIIIAALILVMATLHKEDLNLQYNYTRG